MACCGYASGWAKLSLGCLALASLFQVVAWSTPSWMIGASGGTTTRVGLWKTRICTSVCVESSVDISYKNDAFRATQAMETIAFILLLLMPILAGAYVMSDRFRTRTTAVWCMTGCFVTATFLLMGMVAWLVYVTDPWAVSYSFGFSVIAVVLVIIAGILLIPDVDENNSYRICADCTTSGPSERTKARSVSPDMSIGRSFSRSDRTTPLNSRSEYDQMPKPMLTPVEKTGSASRNLRPATFNNISAKMGGCCGEASSWAKVGFLLLMCATGLQFAGYLTNNWMTYNTVMDTYDLRVGLWWFTNCSGGAACHTENTPSQYLSFEVTLVRWFEGAAGGMFFLCLILSGFYVATDRCRTRCVAVCLLLMTLTAAGLSIAGIVLWVLQVESPYYPAWSMGLSALASSLVLIAAMTLIPDIKEYDYESKSTVYPDHTGKYTRLEKRESVRNAGGGGIPRRPSDIMLTTIGDDTSEFKRSRDLGREYGRLKRQGSVGSSRDFNPYPYGPPSSRDAFNTEQERFDLEVLTPSAPPRYDFLHRKF